MIFSKERYQVHLGPSGEEVSGVKRCGYEIVSLFRMDFKSKPLGLDSLQFQEE